MLIKTWLLIACGTGFCAIIKDLYTGLSSKVKWLGELSEHFEILQGVRQGAILSPFLYKTYITPCLMELKQHRLGLSIGGIYCGCPTCTDDLALLSKCENELQVMSNVVRRHVKKDHVTLHPDKSNVVLLNQRKMVSKKSFSLELDRKKTFHGLRTQPISEFYGLKQMKTLLT